MNNIRRLLFTLALISIATIAVQAAVYVFILPKFFAGYKTYSFFVMGIACSVLLAGYYGYHATYKNISLLKSFLAALISALVVAFVTIGGSLLIILNLVGS